MDKRAEDLHELSRRAADDVGRLVREVKDVASAEVAETGARAVWPAAAVVAGALLGAVGLGMVLASPALHKGKRVRRYGLAYLAGGLAGVAAGGASLAATAKAALPETRAAVRETVEQVGDQLSR